MVPPVVCILIQQPSAWHTSITFPLTLISLGCFASSNDGRSFAFTAFVTDVTIPKVIPLLAGPSGGCATAIKENVTTQIDKRICLIHSLKKRTAIKRL